MRKMYYPRLALDNIKKNARAYVPYMLTCVVTVAMYYIIVSLSKNEGIDRMSGSDFLRVMLGLGGWVTAIFAVIILFYTNSFLMKNRKKEFGLYNILGMEKRHISRVVALETLYTAILSLAAGLALGLTLLYRYAMSHRDPVAWFPSIVGGAVATLLSFLATPILSRILGRIGLSIVVRVLGLILCALAVQFILAGFAESTSGFIQDFCIKFLTT